MRRPRRRPEEWRGWPGRARLEHALVKGIDAFVVDDYREARQQFDRRSRSSKAR
jgi:5-methyltetrahydrofolate--homocysteine methyltransferase